MPPSLPAGTGHNMSSLSGMASTDGLAGPGAELQALRVLCDETQPRARRLEIVQSLKDHRFFEVEHQVVFESVFSLISRDSLSRTRLAAHLNNRGFPDVDMDKYFPPL